ncbi:hypothetical protein ACFV5G_25715 [Streptomyces sp. NPDC059766]|uniref:hypothetical protein n=1 Tax=Streptomyces sp. NPDC059766 TaxID=3346940 RepID=UPI00364E54FF
MTEPTGTTQRTRRRRALNGALAVSWISLTLPFAAAPFFLVALPHSIPAPTAAQWKTWQLGAGIAIPVCVALGIVVHRWSITARRQHSRDRTEERALDELSTRSAAQLVGLVRALGLRPEQVRVVWYSRSYVSVSRSLAGHRRQLGSWGGLGHRAALGLLGLLGIWGAVQGLIGPASVGQHELALQLVIALPLVAVILARSLADTLKAEHYFTLSRAALVEYRRRPDVLTVRLQHERAHLHSRDPAKIGLVMHWRPYVRYLVCVEALAVAVTDQQLPLVHAVLLFVTGWWSTEQAVNQQRHLREFRADTEVEDASGLAASLRNIVELYPTGLGAARLRMLQGPARPPGVTQMVCSSAAFAALSVVALLHQRWN